MDEKNEVLEIDLLELAKALLYRWWIILLAIIIGAAGVGAYAVFGIAPEYQSSILMYVNNSTISVGSAAVSISSGELSAAKTLVDTYCVILKTRLTLEEVIKDADLSYTYEQLKKMISAGSEEGTEIFRITVTSTDPEEACKIANTIAEVLPEKISNVVDGSSVKAVDLAVVPNHRSSPSYSRYALIGALVGAVIVGGVIVVLELFNDHVTSTDWLVDAFKNEYPLLSVIPRSGGKGSKYSRYSKYAYQSYSYVQKDE